MRRVLASVAVWLAVTLAPVQAFASEVERIVRLATVAERAAKIRGLRDFIIATSYTESRWNPDTLNVEDTGAGLALWKRARHGACLRQNPWIGDSARWAHSGGALGQIPAGALSTLDGHGCGMDPAKVFDLPYAIAFATDMVVRLRLRWGARNWDRVRAGMARPAWARRSIRHRGRKQVHRRFRAALRASRPYRVDLYLDDRGVRVGSYTGFEAVLSALLAAEGRTP